MNSTSFRTAGILAAVILLPLLGYVAADLLKGNASSPTPDPPATPPATEVPAAAPQEEPAEADPYIPRGSPIDAPLSAPPGNAADISGAPIRNIPQSSFDMLGEMEDFPQYDDDLNFKKTKDGKFFKINFSQLGSFNYNVPDPGALRAVADPQELVGGQIPDELRALHQQQVVVVGFIVPFEVNSEGMITNFALTQNQAFCCYGVPPAINEMVMVEIGPDVKATVQTDLPIAVYGTLNVGEVIEEGYILSIYQMQASEVKSLPELLRTVEDEEEGV